MIKIIRKKLAEDYIYIDSILSTSHFLNAHFHIRLWKTKYTGSVFFKFTRQGVENAC